MVTDWEKAFDEWPGWRGHEPMRQTFKAGWDAAMAMRMPQPSPDICEKCGQEVIDGHFSLVCHKPTCIKALQEEDADYLGVSNGQS